jgi:hypothetical protein
MYSQQNSYGLIHGGGDSNECGWDIKIQHAGGI